MGQQRDSSRSQRHVHGTTERVAAAAFRAGGRTIILLCHHHHVPPTTASVTVRAEAIGGIYRRWSNAKRLTRGNGGLTSAAATTVGLLGRVLRSTVSHSEEARGVKLGLHGCMVVPQKRATQNTQTSETTIIFALTRLSPLTRRTPCKT